MKPPTVVVVGGGAAGFFAAIACAEAAPGTAVTVLEKGREFLAKVRISGGGRCNVTHACFDARDFASHYPRGSRELIGPFQRFQARDTVEWFAARGVALKREADGRMFPVTDSSQTVLDCLVRSARGAGVTLRLGSEVVEVRRTEPGGFAVRVKDGLVLACDRVLLATGGCRSAALGELAVGLGHSLEEPVPSLFTFHIAMPWLRELPGVAVPDAEVSAPGLSGAERGPVLITHSGLSGPAVLRLSAWGARALARRGYQFPLRVNWLPQFDRAGLLAGMNARRVGQGARRVRNAPIAPLSARLWERLVQAAGIGPETAWAGLSRAAQERLIARLMQTELSVCGKSLNQEEFVTCGGVRLSEVNFKTMESRICPGLHFAGELLDFDGITGGFNFQAAWTTGWMAGRAMAS